MSRLHKHARTATGRVKHHAALRLNRIYNRPYQRRRREKLAPLLRPAHRKLIQEILIDTPKHITRCIPQLIPPKNSHQIAQQRLIKRRIVLWQYALKQL